MRALLRSGLLCLLGVCTAVAGELAPFREGNRLGAHMRNLQFPATFRKDLRSGLTSRLLVRVDLTMDSRVLDMRAVEVAVTYDLWDENFRLTVADGRGVIVDNVLSTEDQVIAYLNDVRLPSLFDMARLTGGREHALKGEVLVNPIETERMAMIRKWVAENSTQTPRGGEQRGRSSPAPVGAATSGDLFNRIFGQYAADADTAAAWRETLQSRPFRPEAVPNEGK